MSTVHNDALATRFYEHGERVAAAVTVQRAPADIYDAWLGADGLTRCSDELQSITRAGPNRTRWAGHTGNESFEWEAEILKDEPGRLLSWRSTGDPPIPNAGSVTFRPLPFRRGTEVRVVVEYIPAKGRVGQMFDKVVGRDPRQYLHAALFRFRQLMETGEVATTRGQPVGRRDGRAEGSRDEIRLAENTP